MANPVRWATDVTIALTVHRHGLVDYHLYRQRNHPILHLVNLTNAGTWRAPVDELIPIGPLSIEVRQRGAARQQNEAARVSIDDQESLGGFSSLIAC